MMKNIQPTKLKARIKNTMSIDWSKSILEIGQQLYKKYNLTEEEIQFIEKMIKPME